MPLKGSAMMMTLNLMTAGKALYQNLSFMLRPAFRSVGVASNKAVASLHSIYRHSKQPPELCHFLLHTMHVVTTQASCQPHPPHPQDSIMRLLSGNFSKTQRQLSLLHQPSTITMPLWRSLVHRLCKPTVCRMKPTRPLLIMRWCQSNPRPWTSVRNPSILSPTTRA